MAKYDAVLLSQVSLALGKGKYFASSKKTLGVLDSLQERGLVRKITLTYRSKRITAYILTECGLRVAKELARMFGV
jgi:DNA-binding PadR family transcriptional regulator